MIVYTDASKKELCVVVEQDGWEDVIIVPAPEGVTTNEAEYLAILHALEILKGDLHIWSDSELAVKQINREYHTKEKRLRVLATQVWGKSKTRASNGWETTVSWLPREENKAGKVLG